MDGEKTMGEVFRNILKSNKVEEAGLGEEDRKKIEGMLAEIQ